MLDAILTSTPVRGFFTSNYVTVLIALIPSVFLATPEYLVPALYASLVLLAIQALARQKAIDSILHMHKALAESTAAFVSSMLKNGHTKAVSESLTELTDDPKLHTLIKEIIES